VTRFSIVLLDPSLRPAAQALSDRLQAPVCEMTDWRECANTELVLLVSADGLALADPEQPKVHPVRVDFEDPALLRRLREAGAKRQDLAKATGVAERTDIPVIDATAGWGRDSAVLAALGANVYLFERNPVVAALLADGIERARLSILPDVASLAGRLLLREGDAARLLVSDPPGGDFVVMMDPMFPERRKSAAVGKEMQFFHRLVGSDEDSDQLLEAALASGAARVVVKRPRKAPLLTDRKPTNQLVGKVTRFDIYALRSIKRAPC